MRRVTLLVLILAPPRPRVRAAHRACPERAQRVEGPHPGHAVRERQAGAAPALDRRSGGPAAGRRPRRARAGRHSPRRAACARSSNCTCPANAVLSRATVIKVGELVGASEVIVGSVVLEGKDGNELVVEAHSIRIDVGRLQPHVRERGPLTDVEELFDRVAGRLAPDAKPRDGRPTRPPLEAFESYVKGLMAESSAARATFLETAIKIVPAVRPRASRAVGRQRRSRGITRRHSTVVRGVPAASPLAPARRLPRGGVDAGAEAVRRSLRRVHDALGVGARRPRGRRLQQPRDRAAAAGRRPPAGLPTYFLTRAADSIRAMRTSSSISATPTSLERNYQGALYWLREALRRDPTDAEAHYVLSAALRRDRQRRWKRRASASSPAAVARITRSSRNARAAEKLPVPRGPRASSRGPDAAGGAALRPDDRQHRAARAAGASRLFHLDRGRRLFEREEDREAMAELRRAVYLSPYEAQAHLLIGRIHLRSGRPAEAIERAQDLDLERRHRRRAHGACRGLHQAAEYSCRPNRAAARARAGPGVCRGQAAAADDRRADDTMRAWIGWRAGAAAARPAAVACRGPARRQGTAPSSTPPKSTASSSRSSRSTSPTPSSACRCRQRRPPRHHPPHARRPRSTPPGTSTTPSSAAKTPVAVFVGPSGNRAASAGFLITMAADVAAMAPGTHIGAAHPVSGDGSKIDETMAKKMASDTASYGRTLAAQRKRNVDADRAGGHREPLLHRDRKRSAPSPPLIDVVANDVPDLLRKLDGRTVTRFDGRDAGAARRRRRHCSRSR